MEEPKKPIKQDENAGKKKSSTPEGSQDLQKVKKGIEGNVGNQPIQAKQGETQEQAVARKINALADSPEYKQAGINFEAKTQDDPKDTTSTAKSAGGPIEVAKKKAKGISGKAKKGSAAKLGKKGKAKQAAEGVEPTQTEDVETGDGNKPRKSYLPIVGPVGFVKGVKGKLRNKAGEAVKKVGRGVEKVGKGVDKVGKGVENTGKAVKTAGTTVKNTGKAIDATGKAIDATGKGMKATGAAMQTGGTAMEAGGAAMDAAGQGIAAVLSETGVGIVVGEGISIAGKGISKLGTGTKSAGTAVENAGESVEGAGQKVQDAGQKVQDKGQSIQDKGQKIQDKGQEIRDKGQQIQEKGKDIQDIGVDIQDGGADVKAEFNPMSKKNKSRAKKFKNFTKKIGKFIKDATKNDLKGMIIRYGIVILIFIVIFICVFGVIAAFIDSYGDIIDEASDIIFGGTATNLNVTAGEPYRAINEEFTWQSIQTSLVNRNINIEDLGLGGDAEKAKKILLKFYKASLATNSLDVKNPSSITLNTGETLIDGAITVKRYTESGTERTLTYIPTTSQTYIDLQTILNTNGGVIENPTDAQKTTITSCLDYYAVDSNGNLIIYYYTTQEIQDDKYIVGDYNSTTSETDCANFTLDNYTSTTPLSTETKEVYTLYSEVVNYEILCQRYGVSFDFLLALSMGMQDTGVAEAIADFAVANTKIEVAIQDSYNYYQGETKYLYEGKFDRTDEAALLNIIGRAGDSSTNLINYTDENSVNKQKGVYTGNTAGDSLWYVYTNKQSALYEASITADYNTYAGMIDTIEQRAQAQMNGLANTLFWNKVASEGALDGYTDPQIKSQAVTALWTSCVQIQEGYRNEITTACEDAKNVAAQDRVAELENLNTKLIDIKTRLESDSLCNWCYKFDGTNTTYTGETVQSRFDVINGNTDADYYNYYENTHSGFGTVNITYQLEGIVDQVKTGQINSQVVPVSALVNENDGSWNYYTWKADILLPAKHYYQDALRVVTETKNEYTSYIYVKSAESWFLNEEFSLFDASVPSTTTEQASAEHTYQLGPKGGSGTQVLNLKYLMDTTEHEEKSEMDMTIEVPLKDGEIKYKKYETSTIEKKQFSTINSVTSTDNKDIILGFLKNTDGSKPYDSSGNLYDKATLSASPYKYVADGVNVLYKDPTIVTSYEAPYVLMKRQDNVDMTLILLQNSSKAQADEQVYRYLIYQITDGKSQEGIESIDYDVFETKTFFSSDVYGFMDWIFPIARRTIPKEFFSDAGQRYLYSVEDEEAGEGESIVHAEEKDIDGDGNADSILEIYWDTEDSMEGTQVIADRDGTATFHINDATYGNYIEILHDDGMISYYYHLANFGEIYSQSADSTSTTKTVDVEQGQVLGAVGEYKGKYRLLYQVKTASGSVADDQTQYINFEDPWGENFAEFVSYTMKYEGTDLATDERTDLTAADGTFAYYVGANTDGKMENGFPIDGWHYAVHGGPNSEAIVGWAKQNDYGWDITVGFGIALYYNLNWFHEVGLFSDVTDVQIFNDELTKQDTGRIYDIHKDSSGNWVKDVTPIEDEKIYEVNLRLMYNHYKGALDSLKAIGKDPKDYEVAQLVALAQVRWGCPGAFQGWISSYLDTDPVIIFQNYAAHYDSEGVNKRARSSWYLYCTGDYDYEASPTEAWYDPLAQED